MNLASEIELKAYLLMEGWRVEKSALEDIGTKYSESSSYLFDFSTRNPGTILPEQLTLPLGSLVNLIYNDRSPFLVKKEDGQLILEKNGKFITTVQWVERPKYYDMLTSDGVKMFKIAPSTGKCGIRTLYNNYCANWNDGTQCKFCNLNPTHKGEDPFIRTKRAKQIYEVVDAILKERCDRNFHLFFTGGTLSSEKEVEGIVMIIEAVIEALKKHNALERAAIGGSMTAPVDLAHIDRIRQAGATFLGFNIEVWDPDIFKAMCPGKAKRVGRERWLEALNYAVSVFGRSYAFSSILIGLEPIESFFEGIEYLCEKGIMPFMGGWMPTRGSKLEGHRPVQVEYLLEWVEKGVNIMAKSLPEVFSDERFRSGDVACYECCGYAWFWDEIRRK